LLILAQDMNLKTEERRVSVDELKVAFIDQTITEAFGAGTAAVVAPIELIGIDGTDYKLPAYHDKSVLNILKHRLNLIRTGLVADHYKWNTVI
jgi:branched-chain amino acid aminotransferase